jgi:hypothetical protein
VASQRVWAKRPLQYGDLHASRGQIFELRNSPNDEKLLGLGFLAPFDPKQFRQTTTCGECGAEFIGHGELARHGDERHPARPRSEEEEERFLDRQEKVLEQLAPLGA